MEQLGQQSSPAPSAAPTVQALLQKTLKEAVETYWTLRAAVDELNPFSSYDQELLGPELHADLDAASYLVAIAADELLAEMAVV